MNAKSIIITDNAMFEHLIGFKITYIKCPSESCALTLNTGRDIFSMEQEVNCCVKTLPPKNQSITATLILYITNLQS